MPSSHDVRIWPKIQKNALKRDRFSYTVRSRVAGEPFKKTFQTAALADTERSTLVTAQRNGGHSTPRRDGRSLRRGHRRRCRGTSSPASTWI
jgi:hypothetical protein